MTIYILLFKYICFTELIFFKIFKKEKKWGKCCFLCSFKARECNDLRSWIFCEMIQLLPVDIAQKRDDKIVREVGDQQALWRKFLKESSVARARPNPEKNNFLSYILEAIHIFTDEWFEFELPRFLPYNSSRVMIAMNFGKNLTDTRIIMKFFCKICSILCDRLMIIVWIWRLRKSFSGRIGQNIITKNFKILSNRIFERRKYGSHARGSFFLEN